MFLVSVREMLRLILVKKIFFASTVSTNLRYHDEHKDSNFLSIIFMAYSETQSLSKTVFKPTV